MPDESGQPEAIYLPENRQVQPSGIEDIVQAEKRAEREFKFQEGLRAILEPYQIALQVKARDFDSKEFLKHSRLEKLKQLLHTPKPQIHTSQWRYKSPEEPVEWFQATMHYFRDDRGLARAVGFICERKTDSTILWMDKNGVIKRMMLVGWGIVKILVDWRDKIGLDVKNISKRDNAIEANLFAGKRPTIKIGRVAPEFTGKLKQPDATREEKVDTADLRTIMAADSNWQFYNVKTPTGPIEGDNVLEFISEILRHIPTKHISDMVGKN